MTFIESLYGTALPLHIGAVFFSLAIVVFSDIYAARWVLGNKQMLSSKLLHRLHILVWIGLITAIIAGFIMFLPYKSYLLTVPAFQIKMVFVFFLVVNAVFINRHMHIATTSTFAELPTKTKIMLIVSGLVSTMGWIGSYVAAEFMGF